MNAEPDSPGPAARRPARWLKPALALSLALNLAVAGVVAGAVLRLNSHSDAPAASAMRGPGGPSAGLSLRTALAALERSDRRALYQQVRSGLTDQAAAPPAAPATEQVLAALRADAFDPAPLRDALEGAHQQLVGLNRVSQDALLDLLATMPPAARTTYADRLEGVLARRDSRWHSPPGPQR